MILIVLTELNATEIFYWPGWASGSNVLLVPGKIFTGLATINQSINQSRK